MEVWLSRSRERGWVRRGCVSTGSKSEGGCGAGAEACSCLAGQQESLDRARARPGRFPASPPQSSSVGLRARLPGASFRVMRRDPALTDTRGSKEVRRHAGYKSRDRGDEATRGREMRKIGQTKSRGVVHREQEYPDGEGCMGGQVVYGRGSGRGVWHLTASRARRRRASGAACRPSP